MSIRNWKIFIISVGAIAVVACAFFLREPRPQAAELDPMAVMTNGVKAFAELSAEGNERITIFRDGRPVFRKVIQTPMEPIQIAQAMGLLDEKAKAKIWVYRRLMEFAENFKFNDDFFDFHKAKVVGAEKVAGRWAWEVEIRPNTGDAGYLRVFFDKDTGYPLKRVKYDRRGLKENSIEFVKVNEISAKDENFRGRGFHPGTMDMFKGEGPNDEPPFGEGPGPGRPPIGPPPDEGPHGIGGPSNPFQPPEGFPKEGPGPKPEAFIPPDVFIKDYVAQSLVLFPTHLPEGYRFAGGLKLPRMAGDKLGKVHMIFIDGVNSFSLFQIHLPRENLHGGDAGNFLRAKTKEFLNSFPEGCAIRKVEEGLIVGMGDIDPVTIEKVLDSMVLFKGDQPIQFDKKNLNPEGLF